MRSYRKQDFPFTIPFATLNDERLVRLYKRVLYSYKCYYNMPQFSWSFIGRVSDFMLKMQLEMFNRGLYDFEDHNLKCPPIPKNKVRPN